MDEEAIVSTNTDFLVTETTIKTKVTLERICTILKVRKTTGTLALHFIDGGICRILLSEKTKANDSQGEKIRGVLGMS